MRDPLPQDEFDWIFSRVPRLTVEVVIACTQRGVLLALRDFGPCKGLWHLPGGTVRFGEPVTEAVKRVALDELGLTVTAEDLLGYIEYPSHYDNGLDSPVGLAFRGQSPPADMPDERDLRSDCGWFTTLPDNMHDEQKEFLARHLGIVEAPAATDHNLTALGGGASNTAFLAGDSSTTANAKTSRVEARFWIETMSNPGHPDALQLQYTQLVILDFNQIHWPHVTVATLRKQ